jgi:hypothetical protein
VLEGGPAVVTLGTGRYKRGSLLFQHVLLQRREKLFGFRQCQAEVLEALAVLVEGRDLLHLFLTAIVCTDHELHLQFHEESSALEVIRMKGYCIPECSVSPAF